MASAGGAAGLLGMLAVFTLGLGGANVQDKGSEMLTEISAVRDAVRLLYAGREGYVGLSDAVLADSKKVPGKWVVPGGLTEPYGGRLHVRPTADGSGFTVSLSGIPAGACAKAGGWLVGTGAVLRVNGVVAAARNGVYGCMDGKVNALDIESE